MLSYSLAGLSWFQAGCVAAAPARLQSFHYAMPAIDDDDLILHVPTSIDADNQHASDVTTFHRVRDFRALALPLAAG